MNEKKMGDSYDEDEGRLMIDDAILDSTHSSQTGCAETSSKTTTYEKTVELTLSSEDGKFLLIRNRESLLLSFLSFLAFSL